MAEQWVEVFKESRSMDLTYTSFEQQIVVEFELDPDNLTPDFTGGGLFELEDEDAIDDDDIKALEYVFDLFPIVRLVPNQAGDTLPIIFTKLSLKQMGNLRWRATATYSRDTETGTGGSDPEDENNDEVLDYAKINFVAGGTTRHVTNSLGVISKVGKSDYVGPLPNILSEIGATDDSVEGADIYGTGLTISVTGYYRPTFVDYAFVNMLELAAATMNSHTFMGRQPGEVLFTQASGGGTVVDIIPITFDFIFSKNISNQPDPGFPNLTMLGHDLLDYRYERSTIDGRIAKYPYVRLVHRNYKFHDHNAFKLPV